MTEKLIVDDDEARALAEELAERRGVSVAEAVVSSLRASLDVASFKEQKPTASPPAPVRIPSLEEMTPEQRARYDRLGAIAQEAAAHSRPGASSDHRDMYDEYGLPK